MRGRSRKFPKSQHFEQVMASSAALSSPWNPLICGRAPHRNISQYQNINFKSQAKLSERKGLQREEVGNPKMPKIFSFRFIKICIFDNKKEWTCCWTAPVWLIGLNQEKVTLCKSHVASLPRYRLQEINSSARNMSLLTMTYLLSTSFIVSYDLLQRGSKYLLAPGEKTEFFSPNHELWEAEQTSPEAHCVAFHCKAAANRDKSGDKVFATNCHNICGNPEEMVTL